MASSIDIYFKWGREKWIVLHIIEIHLGNLEMTTKLSDLNEIQLHYVKYWNSMESAW